MAVITPFAQCSKDAIPRRHLEEAIQNITEAIELYIESLIAEHQPVPKEDLIVKPLSILV